MNQTSKHDTSHIKKADIESNLHLEGNKLKVRLMKKNLPFYDEYDYLCYTNEQHDELVSEVEKDHMFHKYQTVVGDGLIIYILNVRWVVN